jgi:4-hydroxy-3-methylbut-2-enyl diphosphate reductase
MSAAAGRVRGGDGGLLILAPLSIEARAARAGAGSARVRRIGLGPRRAERAARLAGEQGGDAVLIAGFCGALDPELRPGDVVLASELRGPTGTTACADTAILAGALRRAGLRVRTGPIASSRRLVLGERRSALWRTGALAVDMESAWIAPAAAGRPLVALRTVVDTRRHELHRPLRTLGGALLAYRTLRLACGLAEEWALARQES